jgi:hypothetical protein
MERLVVLRPEHADLSREFSSSFVLRDLVDLTKRVANSWRRMAVRVRAEPLLGNEVHQVAFLAEEALRGRTMNPPDEFQKRAADCMHMARSALHLPCPLLDSDCDQLALRNHLVVVLRRLRLTSVRSTGRAVASGAALLVYCIDLLRQSGGHARPRFHNDVCRHIDPFWPKPFNGLLGMTIGVWVDEQDYVWIIHRSSATLHNNEKGAKDPLTRHAATTCATR